MAVNIEEGKGATFGAQLVALLRHNGLLKWRQKKKLAVEILMPLYFVVLLWLIRMSIPKYTFPEETESRTAADLFNVSFMKRISSLAVAPSTNQVQDFINKTVLPKWKPVLKTSPPNVIFFNEEKDMMAAYVNGSEVPLGIVFTGDPNGALNFTIRTDPSLTPDTELLLAAGSDCRDPGYKIKSLLPPNMCSADKYVFSGVASLLGFVEYAWITRDNMKFKYVPSILLQLFPKSSFHTSGLTAMRLVLPLFLVMAMNNFIPQMLVLLVGEKEKKLKESMLAMGTSVTAYWISWFLLYCGIVLVTTIIITVSLSQVTPLEHTNYVLLAVLLFLYGISIVMLGYIIVPFFDKAKPASLVGAFAVFLSSLTYYIQVYVQGAHEGTFWALSLLSPAAMGLAGDRILMLDTTGAGGTFSNLWVKGAGGSIPLAGSLIMLSVDIVLYGLLAYYLDSVWPSEYGTKHKPWFCLQPSYWFPKRMVTGSDGEGSDMELPDHPDVEPVSSEVKSKLAVRIRNLAKIFKSLRKPEVKAVNGVSLDMYEGQITAILGHNGAGKTTLLNVLTGLTASSGGKATICGLDVSDPNDLYTLRIHTGICPQHDVLFEDLTPWEHLEFFGQIKGLTGQQLENEIRQLLVELRLDDKARSPAKELSGGQKRKLSVAVALIGDPKVIFLDEPTAGMDPYSRRCLWNLMQARKKDKVVVLTTHFMDEADLLADRKAVLSKGRLRCCGSSMFLKNKFGIGYHLTMAVEPHSNEDAITTLVHQYVKSAECDRRHGRELAFILPREEVSHFPKLFAALEGPEKVTLGITSYGVSMATLEEVFLHLGVMEEGEESSERPTQVEGLSRKMVQMHHSGRSESQKLMELANIGPAYGSSESKFELSSCNLEPSAWRSFVAVAKVRIRRLYRDYSALFCVIILPLILTIVSMTTVRVGTTSPSEPPISLDAGLYNLHNSDLLYSKKNSSGNVTSFLMALGQQLKPPIPILKEKYNGNFSSLLTTGNHFAAFDINSFDFNHPIPDLDLTLRFNDTQQHSIPVLINMVMNSLLSLTNKVKMQAWMHPFPPKQILPNFNGDAFVSSMLVGMVFAFVPAGLVVDMVNDREVKARSLLRLNGLTLPIYFASYFAVLGSVLILVSVCLLILILAFQLPALSPAPAVGTLALFLSLYWVPSLLFAACFSYAFSKVDTAQSVFANVAYMVGFIPFVLVSVLNFVNHSVATTLNTVFCLLDPPYLPYAILYYINMVYLTCQMEGPLCGGLYFTSYFTEEVTMIFVAIGVQIVVFLLLLVILDTISSGGTISEAFQIGKKKKPEISFIMDVESFGCEELEDDDVKEERRAVEQVLSNPTSQKPVVLVQNLRKVFDPSLRCGRSFSNSSKSKAGKVAVYNLSFMVQPGEVFGLLGPNGAGKTTTLRMMVTEEKPTRGRMEISGCDVSISQSAFKEMGYCPQHDALWKNVTVAEHLECFASVRGVMPQQIDNVVHHLTTGLGIEEHASKQSKECSGGTKRKLSFSMSIIGAPKLVLMDEPSTGMDPQSKRFLWDVVSAVFTGQGGQRGAVLTTHSMEEADALSTRIGIMVRGGLRCIGATQHLKDKYGGGYMLEVRCREGRNQEVGEFALSLFPKATVQESFADRIVMAVPRDDVISLAEAFRKLEEAKESLEVLEYSLSQTTLEQVFLHFAKQQENEEDD